MTKKIILLILGTALTGFFFGCATTQTYWVPIYTVKYSADYEKTKYDPRIQSIINPQEGELLAYFEMESKNSIAYGNDYSISLAEKVVIANDQVDSASSTTSSVTNLEIQRSFYYDIQEKEEPNLYIYRDGTIMALDHSAIKADQIVHYMILGKNVGTNPISQIVIADVLPKGFHYISSEYFLPGDDNVFEHKVVTKNSKTTLILASRMKTPLMPAGTLMLKVTLKAQFDEMEKEFSY